MKNCFIGGEATTAWTTLNKNVPMEPSDSYPFGELGTVGVATRERIQMVLPYFPLQIEKQPGSNIRSIGFSPQKDVIDRLTDFLPQY